MTASPHRIRRQRWVVQAGSTESAFRIRKHLRDEGQNLLLPIFEKAFDQAAGGTETLRIPKIELFLKVTSEDELSRLSECIYDQLIAQVAKPRRASPSIAEESATYDASAEKESSLEILLYYLRTGSVPWQAANCTAPELLDQLREICRACQQELQEILLSKSEEVSAAFYFRLFQLVSASDARRLLENALQRIQRPWRVPLVEVLVSLLRESRTEDFSGHLRLELASRILSEALARRRSTDALDLSLMAETLLSPGSDNALARFVSSLPAPAAALFRLRGRRGSSPAADLPFDSTSPADKAELHRPGVENSPAMAGASQTQECNTLARQAPNHLQPEGLAEFPLMVTHAGLILLHPFLPRFFEATRVKEESGLRLSPLLLARAAALLHFLASGQEEIYEFDLAFIKVLLGLEPDTTLCVSQGLIESSDKEEAESLLMSAITHWAALKSTSITGLRSSFLNRQALLRANENGWKLQVERTAFDVLLDRLPWSTCVVKLPWMTRPIYTEW